MKKITLIVLLLFPLVSQAWWNEDWSFRKQIGLDTTPSGLSLAENLNNVTVLVRLHTGNFNYFLDLKDNAADLRFIAGDDQTPLKFHIEKFDPINEMALIWVNVPILNANDNSDSIWMYYGNPAAVPADDAQGSYDVNQVLAYHFNQPHGSVTDQTAYSNNPSRFEAENQPTSVLGSGAQFSGKQAIVVPANPSLKLTPEAGWTFSSWVKVDATQTDATLFLLGANNQLLRLVVDGTSIYSVLKTAAGRIETPRAPLTPASWQHVALVLGKGLMTLYINGNPAGSASAALAEIPGELIIGASTSDGQNGFIGEIDEVTVSNKERSASWIKLLAQTQGSDSKLLSYGEDEQAQAADVSHSYFGIILQNVTVDGWVVIVLLGVMAAISWVVMLGKGVVISRVRKDNRAFIEAYRDLGKGDPAKLDHAQSEEEKELAGSAFSQALFGKHDHFQSSTLYQVYHTGIQDLQRRFGTPVGADVVKALTPQAIDTIRAALDATLVRESQKLNSQMVLLTIAISGGPFLGLLGTVVGVMITFAAIAASGDVNVNAIAPGIAAALVATVAGLAVAIPALFAYNYLGSRIKEISADMHVFVDEFVTRIAEHYADK